MKPINKIEKFQIGTKFIGKVNKHLMEILGIEQIPLTSGNGRPYLSNKKAIVKDHTTGETFKTSYSHLASCSLKVL